MIRREPVHSAWYGRLGHYPDTLPMPLFLFYHDIDKSPFVISQVILLNRFKGNVFTVSDNGYLIRKQIGLRLPTALGIPEEPR